MNQDDAQLPGNNQTKWLRRCHYLFYLKIKCTTVQQEDAIENVPRILKRVFTKCKSYFWLKYDIPVPDTLVFKCYCHYDKLQRPSIDSTLFEGIHNTFPYSIVLKEYAKTCSAQLLTECQKALFVTPNLVEIKGFRDSLNISKELAFNEAMKAFNLDEGIDTLNKMLGRFQACSIKELFIKEYTAMKYKMIEERELKALMEGFPIDYDNELIQGVVQWIKECFDEPTTRIKTN